ncbi:hypothetical protein ACJ73_04072 [Blastomyces percursus]|uniref:Uncharacterized protein n=1 Tax=Blastomyces percursus TaxID=1658174 RepID=A0A1J9R9A5_9EURO|nr:hypothetical protein ACJ73_04072 [Blastomyces percursus]
MSGSNPFRHKKKPTTSNDNQTAPQQLHQPLQASSISAHSNHLNHSAAIDPASARTHGEGPSQPSHRQKSVRIASPPVATQPSLHLNAGDHPSPASNRASILHHGTPRGSSPPPSVEESSSSEDDSAGDPFNPDASGSDNEDYGDIGEGRHVVEGKHGVVGLGLEEAQRGSREPYGAERAVFPPGQDPKTSRSDSMTPLPSATKGKRATMDVDAFTRMLMTGETGGVGKEPVSATRQPLQPTQGPAISDSSSNTDTGSTSKQLIFETRHLPRVETPRTSHELSASEADDERRKLAAAAASLPKPAERPKPPPPKTRRGKTINPNAGHTSPLVGLASFTSPNHRSASPASLSSRSFTEQESGDVNKPLPQAPVDNSFLSVSPEQTAQDSENISPLPLQKRPPTPPLSRRRSQLKPSNPRLSRNNSARHSMPPINTTKNSVTGSSIHISSPLKSPPPPPSRRKDRESSAFSSSDTPSLLSHERQQPSSRQRSDSREDASDKSSLRSVETTSTISNKRASHGPPRPPPPRRVGGSRASLDESRPVFLGVTDSSTARIDMKNTENTKSGTPGTPSQSQSHAVDILADLSRLQKEVDDLRGRYEGRKASG